jgi:hypothetical protein
VTRLRKEGRHDSPLRRERELRLNLGRVGLTAGADPFDPEEFSDLLSRDPSAPFTGGGATGTDQRSLRIPFVDAIRLALRQCPALVRYSNPISSSGSYASLRHYLWTLTKDQRARQAELMLRRPITSAMADSYGGRLPSRGQVVASAAHIHRLDPCLLAAFLLAEQRDQSRNEDAAEYLAAVSMMRADTSVGLGQIRISAVPRLDLFADLLSRSTRESLGSKEIATLLVSDEFNIFATARYIRALADSLSMRREADIPRTVVAFPGIVLADYAKNSAEWPDGNVRALASKYTSTPSGDQPVRDWADFVVEARTDVAECGCLGPYGPKMQSRMCEKASNKYL